MGGRAGLLLLACGLLSTAAQVALLRELVAASRGVELLYLAGLGAWLAGGAAGSLAERPPREGADGAPPPRSPSLPLALLALLLPASAAFLRGSRHLFGAPPGTYLPLGAQGATALLGLAPAGFLFALLFRRAVEGAAAGGSGTGASYGRECAGAALGSALATLSLLAGAGNLASLLAVSALSAAFAAGTSPRGRGRGAAVLIALLLAAAVPFSPALDRWSASLSHPGTTAVADTPYGRVSVVEEGGKAAFLENDALSSDTESTEGEEFAHLAALQAEPGGRFLLLGGAAGGMAEPLLGHRPRSVTVVEQDRRAFGAVLPRLSPGERGALSSPAVSILFDDPRRFLSLGKEPFDAILVSAPEPLSAAANRYYTAEFFREAASRLSPRGVLAFRLPGSENYRSPLQGRRDGTIRAALALSFPSVLVVPGGTDTWIASRGTVERSGEVLARRLADRGIAARLVTPPWLRYVLSPERVEEAERSIAAAPASPNRDGSPECFALAALLWAGRFAPSLVAREATGLPAAAGGAAALAAALLLLPAARRRGGKGGAARGAFAAGFTGMALEGALVLRFQAASGSLYGDLGILLFAFMAGMGAGALLHPRLPRPLPLLCAFSLLCAAALASPAAAPLFRLLPASALLFLGAALCGAAFARAADGPREGDDRSFRRLYAADLSGSALALAATLLLLPFLGAAAVALLCAASCAGAAAAEGRGSPPPSPFHDGAPFR